MWVEQTYSHCEVVEVGNGGRGQGPQLGWAPSTVLLSVSLKAIRGDRFQERHTSQVRGPAAGLHASAGRAPLQPCHAAQQS